MTIRYTAQGSSAPGDEFRNDVIDVLEANNVRYQGRLYVDARAQLASAWQAFMLPPPPKATTQTLAFPISAGMLPYLPSVQLDEVAVKIDLGEGVTIPSDAKFATLAIGTNSYPLEFDAATRHRDAHRPRARRLDVRRAVVDRDHARRRAALARRGRRARPGRAPGLRADPHLLRRRRRRAAERIESLP